MAVVVLDDLYELLGRILETLFHLKVQKVECLEFSIWFVPVFEKHSSGLCVRSLENDLSVTLTLDHRLSLGSDDEADLVKELQSMCSSKSESDISKVSIARFRVIGSVQ